VALEPLLGNLKMYRRLEWFVGKDAFSYSMLGFLFFFDTNELSLRIFIAIQVLN